MPVRFEPRALKDAERLAEADRLAVLREIAAFVAGRAPNADIRKLQGRAAYRLRIGRWRVLFERADAVVVVQRILDRKDAYR
ncbi:MAG: type II toxin-antitoxin system RelE/ParE family toxin [Firmicutes bacterium]|nr:type II toxin-antitoxin system RelE/ParE family toxin [Bacillota bacterium]